MKCQLTILSAAVLLAAVSWTAPLSAEDGQDDLNKATEKKMSAATMEDLNEIIQLTESALKKGLDDSNKDFANKMLAATLTQRGLSKAAGAFALYRNNQTDPRWQQIRQQAIADLESAIKIDSKQPQALMLVVELNARLPEGDSKRAKEAANQAVEAAGDDAAMKANALAMRASLEEDLEKRLPDMNEAVRLAGDNPNIIRARGAILADLGKNEEALADLDKSLELEPGNVGSFEAKIMVLTRMGKYDEAIAVLDKVQEKMPDSTLPLLQKAQIHNQQGKPDVAIEDLTKAYEKDIGNIGIIMMRSSIYFSKGDKQKALADADECLRLRPKNAEATRFRALLLVDMDRMDEAIASLQALPTSDPKETAKNILTMVQIFGTKKQWDKALEVYNKYLEKDPENVDYIRGRALVLAEMNRIDEAAAAMQKLIDRDPKDLQNVITLAQLYVTNKKSAKAIEIYNKVLEKDPNNEDFLRGRGDAYLNLGKAAEAIADYEKAYKINPKDSGLLNNFAWVLATTPDDKLRDGKRALVMALQACELTEYKASHILSTLAAAYAETGDFENAKKWSAKAVEIGMKDKDEELKKELESYQQNKPWREVLNEDETPEKKPAA